MPGVRSDIPEETLTSTTAANGLHPDKFALGVPRSIWCIRSEAFGLRSPVAGCVVTLSGKIMKILVALLCFAFGFAGCAKHRPETLTDEYDRMAMDAAIATAKSRIDEFIEILGRRGADSFSVKTPIRDENGTEHFWITDVSYENGVFVGKIGDDPGIVKIVEFGQTWKVKKEDISDWMFTIGDKIHGGFTIDPLLASFPKEKADAIRSKLVR